MIVTSARGVPVGVRAGSGLGFWAILAQLGSSLLSQNNKPAPVEGNTGDGWLIAAGLVGVVGAGALVYFLVRDPPVRARS